MKRLIKVKKQRARLDYFVVILALLFPMMGRAQNPVFVDKANRSVLDQLTFQFSPDDMDPGEMDERDNEVLTYMRNVMASHCAPIEGFSVYADSVYTDTVHLHWDAGEVMDETYDMDVIGRWIYDIEWPSDEVDPRYFVRNWIEEVVRGQMKSTFGKGGNIVPFPTERPLFAPMMAHYANQYVRLYRNATQANHDEGEREGAFTKLYQVDFNPVLFIRVRSINEQYITFYVSDFQPGYRSTPSYYQQTLNRSTGKPIWLEDIVGEGQLLHIKQVIRQNENIESDADLDEVIRNHDYALALTDSGIIVSFFPYTFSITVGSDAFQVLLRYEEVNK